MTNKAILWHWLMARCWVLKVRMRTASRNFFLFSGQTAKPSACTQAGSNRPNYALDEVIDAVQPQSSGAQQGA